MSKRACLFALAVAVLAVPAFAYDIIPCAVGNKWEYDTVKLQTATMKVKDQALSSNRYVAEGTSVYSVVGVDEKSGPVFDYSETLTLRTSKDTTDVEKTAIKLSNDARGVLVHSTVTESSSGSKPESQTYDPPLHYYVNDAKPGAVWDVGAFKDGDISDFVRGKAVGKEDVTVPAGTFKDCLKVTYTGDSPKGTFSVSDAKFRIAEGKSVSVYWIADKVGVVKELEVASSKAEGPGPGGVTCTMESVSCTVSELKPGYTVKTGP